MPVMANTRLEDYPRLISVKAEELFAVGVLLFIDNGNPKGFSFVACKK